MRKMRIALAACVAMTMTMPVNAGLLGSSEVEDCVDNGEERICNAATISNLSTSFGLPVQVEFSFPAVGGSELVRLEIEKRPPTVTYPLIYHHTVPFAPKDRAGELLFDGYRIGAPVTDYQVDVKWIAGLSVSSFTLSPGYPTFLASEEPEFDGEALQRAELVGDFAAPRGLPDLGNFILYIPASPSDHPYVERWQENMLLVPREEVSYEGTECNKVGYRPKGLLGWRRGRCLNNQLIDKHEADLISLLTNPDIDTTYLVRGMRDFKRTRWFIDHSGAKVISFEPSEIQHTQVVLLTDAADQVRGIVTESQATISEAIVLVDPFESHSRDGTLSVEIRNTGNVEASYIVEVTNCDRPIHEPIPAQAWTLKPLVKSTFYFNLYSTDNSDAAGRKCTVTLKSPRGKIYHRMDIFFGTARHPSEVSNLTPGSAWP